MITPEIMAERAARRNRRDHGFQSAYYQLLANYDFTKAVFTTSADKKKKEFLEHWATKWRVSLKSYKDHNMTSKMLFDRHLMQLVIKVTPTVEAAKGGTHLGVNLPGMGGESQGSRNSGQSINQMIQDPEKLPNAPTPSQLVASGAAEDGNPSALGTVPE